MSQAVEIKDKQQEKKFLQSYASAPGEKEERKSLQAYFLSFL